MGQRFEHAYYLATLQLVLWLSPLAVGFLLYEFRWISDAWIVEETSREYLWMAFFAVLYTAAGWLVLRPDLKGVLALAVFAAICGWLCGPQLMIALNCAADGSPGRVAEARFLEYVHRERRRPGSDVRFELVPSPGTAGEASLRPPPGVVFRSSQISWGAVDSVDAVQQRRFEVHRGRLGLWWGRLLDE
jgi:hypothetical protein